MRKKCSNSFKDALCAVIVFTWIFAAIGNFIANMTKIENSTARENLKFCAEYNAAEVYSTFQRYTDSLNLLAEIIQLDETYDSTGTMKLLRAITEKKRSYKRISIDTAEGKSYNTDGYILNIADEKYLDKIRNSESFVYVYYSPSYDEKLVNISVPLKDSGEHGLSALCLSIPVKSLSVIFSETFSLEDSYSQIIDSNGNKIAETDSPNQLLGENNFFEFSQLLDFNDSITPNSIKKAFAKQQSGFIEYSYNNQYRYAYYTPVGINGWIMLTSIPKDSVQVKTSQNLINAFHMTIQIAAVFLIIAIYIFINQRRSKNKILLNQKYLETLTEYSGKTIYEWEIKANKLRRLTKSVNINESGRESLMLEESPIFTFVHPDDLAILNHLYDIAKLGGNFNDCRLRIKNNSGEYIWYSITGISVTDSDGNAYKMIAFIENVNDRVLREADLSHKAETDSLTGLFNKATTESTINDILNNSDSQKQSHVLMIVDADNFKDINDKFGHKFGDDVLIELSKKLKSLFRSNDIVGRIGGDEFFVFLKNTSSEKLIKSKAYGICRAFRNTYTLNGVSVSTSASIGIALYPQNGKDFNSLYKNADTALYISKERGKDTYTIYDGVSSAYYQSNRSYIGSENKQ